MLESIIQQAAAFDPSTKGIIDIMILLTQYQWFLLVGLVAAVYFGFVKWFTNPLLTRNQHELILILSPGKAKVLKATERVLPFFFIKRGAYWFTEPLKINVKLPPKKPRKVKKERVKKITRIDCTNCGNKKVKIGKNCRKCKTLAEMPKVEINATTQAVEDVEPEQTQFDTGSMVHVFVDAVNQPVYDLKRNENKILDLVTHRSSARSEVKPHKVVIPPSFGFGTNWIVAIDSANRVAYIERTRKKQPYKINFFVRVGVYLIKEAQAQTSQTSSAKATLEAITVQKVIEQVGSVVKNTNFSAGFARKLIKDITRYEYGWIMTLLGLFDPRIIVIMLIMFGGIAMYLLFGRADMSSLGPPPPGVNLP